MGQKAGLSNIYLFAVKCADSLDREKKKKNVLIVAVAASDKENWILWTGRQILGRDMLNVCIMVRFERGTFLDAVDVK